MEKTIEQLQAENEALKAEIEMLNAINDELQKEIEAAKIKPAPVETTSRISKEFFVRNGITYGFVLPGVKHKDEVITADHILASEDLQDELIRIKSGMLKIVK